MVASNLRMKTFGLIAFVLVCMLTLAYLYQTAGGRIRLSQPYNAKALVPDTFNIVPNSDIRKDGVTIGRVKTVEPSGQVGEVLFEIEDEDHAQLYRDATVKVRTKTLVGESYLEVDAGDPRTGELPSGATLPLEQAVESVPLERILSTLDGKTREEVRRNLAGLGEGLDGRGGDLNRTFGAMKPFVASTGGLVRALEPQKQQLAALIGNTGEVLEAFGERETAFRELVTDAKQTAEAVAARDTKLAEVIDELEPTLERAESSVAKLSSFSTRATPVTRDLKVAATNLGPVVEDLGPTARQTRTLFNELEPFLDRVEPLLDELRPASGSLRELVGPLDAVLRQANPIANFLKPYDRELAAFFSNVGDIVSADAVGNRGRVFPVLNANSLTGLNSVPSRLVDALVSELGLQELYNPGVNPYPKPGTVGDPKAGDGTYPAVAADE